MGGGTGGRAGYVMLAGLPPRQTASRAGQGKRPTLPLLPPLLDRLAMQCAAWPSVSSAPSALACPVSTIAPSLHLVTAALLYHGMAALPHVLAQPQPSASSSRPSPPSPSPPPPSTRSPANPQTVHRRTGRLVAAAIRPSFLRPWRPGSPEGWASAAVLQQKPDDEAGLSM